MQGNIAFRDLSLAVVCEDALVCEPWRKLKSVVDRSFSIQPQFRLMHQRMDNLSRGSSQERLGDIYKNIANVVKATTD